MKKVMIAIGKLTGGGAERVASVWANQLSLLGCKVSILSLFQAENEYAILKDVDVYRISNDKDTFFQMPLIKKFIAFRKIIRTEQPDYIISFLPYLQTWSMLASVGLGIKRIDTVRNNLDKERFPNILQKFLWKMSYCTCNRIVLQSSEQASFLTKRQQKKCVVIPNPVDDIYLHTSKETVSPPLRYFVAAGRIHAQKNYPLMIKAFTAVCRKQPDLKLNIYGTGRPEYIEFLQNLISAEGMEEHISLMGRVNHIEEEYIKHDVFLMTSDYEGMPNALAEAMASKLICISTDCKTGPRDLIDDGINGFLVPVGDAVALEQTITCVLDLSRVEIEAIATQAREKILTYCSKENSTQRLLDVFK